MKSGLLVCFVVILSFFCLSCCTFRPAPNGTRDFADFDLYKRVVKVEGQTFGGVGAYAASGFALDSERILTAGHFCLGVYDQQIRGVIKDEIKVYYVNNNGEIASMDGARIDAMNEKMDLCVLKRVRHGIIPLRIATHNKIEIHDKIMIAGAPLGIFPYTAEGRVMVPKSEGFPIEDINNRLIINAPAFFGVSGGPVINEEGYVIGVVMAKTPFDRILFSVRAETIHRFLKEEYGE